jgi:hypothetical protein
MAILKRADLPPVPPSQITVQCPYCHQQFHLNYSTAERDRVAALVKAAESAIRQDHKFLNHSEAIDLSWVRTS